MRWIGAAFGFGLVVMAGVQGFVTLAIGFTLIRWLGQGALTLVSSLAITHWFERRRGRVFGVTSPAISGLMSLTPLVLGLAVAAYGVRVAWLLAAAAVWLVVIPIGHFGIVDRPSPSSRAPPPAVPPPAARPSPSPDSFSWRASSPRPPWWPPGSTSTRSRS